LPGESRDDPREQILRSLVLPPLRSRDFGLGRHQLAGERFREESLSEELSARQRQPRPGGGEIIKFDPDQRSFKHSLIAIVFAGVYLEALLYLHGCRLLGKVAYKKIDWNTYEEKLRAYGITDQSLLDAAKEFRIARRELVHEKAHDDTKEIRTGQTRREKPLR